ncbi:FxsA family protein [Aestuariibius sp. 2305UL40-4]|uniref:FxsA family protein n=1 Tax=Aestuariibius violaceus TaxID=3234132 RepID=UPI00345EEFB9
MPLLLLFIIIPIVEIFLFIEVGGWIGTWPTLLIVVLTAIAGTYLVRSQGRAVLNDLRRSFSDYSDPSQPLVRGAMVLVAGALLLTPGFFTDTVGFLLLAPPVQRKAFDLLRQKMRVYVAGSPQPRQPRDEVIDGDFTEVPPEQQPTHRPSGWTRH